MDHTTMKSCVVPLYPRWDMNYLFVQPLHATYLEGQNERDHIYTTLLQCTIMSALFFVIVISCN